MDKLKELLEMLESMSGDGKTGAFAVEMDGDNKAIKFKCPFGLVAERSFIPHFTRVVNMGIMKWKCRPEEIKVTFQDRSFDCAVKATQELFNFTGTSPIDTLKDILEMAQEETEEEIQMTEDLMRKERQRHWDAFRNTVKIDVKSRTIDLGKGTDWENLRMSVVIRPVLLHFKYLWMGREFEDYMELSKSILDYSKLSDKDVLKCLDHDITKKEK